MTYKKYWVKYSGEYRNEYSLVWTDGADKPEEGKGWERITRKEAEWLCLRELRNRKFNPEFSGYGDTEILPYRWGTEEVERWYVNRDNADCIRFVVYPWWRE